MIHSLLIVAEQVLVLFALMAVGFVCNKTHLIEEKAVKGMVNLLVTFVTPCLIVHVFQRPFDGNMMAALGMTCIVAILAHIIGILASFLLFGKDERQRSVLRFAVIFSNAGFMGIPLEQAILGNDGVFFGIVYVVAFNVFCWTYGLVVMCGSLKDVSVKGLLVNPGTIGLLLALPFFFFSWKLPPLLHSPVKMISDLNTPLAMTVIGYYLAEAKFAPVLKCGSAYFAGFLRLVAIPSAMLGVLMLFGRLVNPVMAVAMVIASSAPVAALTTMLGVRYDRDVPLSVALVSASTLISILTMPVIVGLAMWYFHL